MDGQAAWAGGCSRAPNVLQKRVRRTKSGTETYHDGRGAVWLLKIVSPSKRWTKTCIFISWTLAGLNRLLNHASATSFAQTYISSLCLFSDTRSDDGWPRWGETLDPLEGGERCRKRNTFSKPASHKASLPSSMMLHLRHHAVYAQSSVFYVSLTTSHASRVFGVPRWYAVLNELWQVVRIAFRGNVSKSCLESRNAKSITVLVRYQDLKRPKDLTLSWFPTRESCRIVNTIEQGARWSGEGSWLPSIVFAHRHPSLDAILALSALELYLSRPRLWCQFRCEIWIA